MSNIPLVTIITSCYNHEKFLDDYFQGLLSQTYRNIELIIFDDGSSDASWEKIHSYEPSLKNKFSRIVCERHENVGLLKELELALRIASGKYLCLLASDDYYLPEMIETVTDYLETHPDIGVVHSDADFIYNGHIQFSYWKSKRKGILEGQIFEKLLERYAILICTACMRMELVKKYTNLNEYINKKFYIEDYPIMLDLARYTKFGYINKSLVCYRANNESMSRSQNPEKKIEIINAAHWVRLNYINKYGVPEETIFNANKNYYNDLYNIAFEYYCKKKFFEGYKYLIKHNPKEYKKLWHTARAISMNNKLLWWLVKRLQEKEVLSQLRNLFRKIYIN